MILIWRGLGFLTVLCSLIGLGLGVMAGTAIGGATLGAGAGLLVGSAGGAVLGWWLNMVRPEAEIAKARDGIRQDLWARVRAGQFQMAPGAPAPQSEAEAHQQVEAVAGAYEPELKKLRNRHTVFWIPMQYASAALAALGLVIMIVGVFQVITGS